MSLSASALGFTSVPVNTARGTLWVHEAGPRDARPLLLVHGLGRGGVQLLPLGAAFRGTRRVLVPDLFDLGGRSRARGRAPTIPEHASVLGELLARHEAADVVGVSLGGWIATWLAASHPERVRGLYLVNPAGTRPDAEAVGALYRETARSGELYRKVVHGWPFLGVPVVSALLERQFVRVLQTAEIRALLDGVDESHFVEHALPLVTCRVHLLLGGGDQLVDPRQTLRVWRERGRAVEGTWVERTSHNLGYEAFEVLLDDLARYLGMAGAPRSWITTFASHLRVPPRTRPLGEVTT